LLRRISRLCILPMMSLVIGFSWATATRAQFLPRYDSLRVKCMKYRNSDGERGRTHFYYGRDGVLRSALWMLDDHSRCSSNHHLYDAQSREIEKYRQFSDGLTSTERYEYDDTGRRTGESFHRSDGKSGNARFHWDEVGRLAASDCERYKGWLTARIDYRYSDGRCNEASISRNGDNIGTIEYIYDSAGHLQEEVWDFGGTWNQAFIYEYETVPSRIYSPSSPLLAVNTRYRVSGETYDYNNQIGGPSSYRYDKNGRLLEKVFERTDGLKTTTSYKFDTDGNLLTSHRVYSSCKTADFHYAYDDALRLAEKTFERSDGVAGYERYAYDRLGRLVSATYKNMDFWLTGGITFTYNKWGHLEGGHYKGENGLEADLDITTDVFGNVLSVHWKFTDGVTQTYTFTYRPID
jgi:hypothetical protein